MSANNEVIIDENIRPYLNEIAERLWSTPSHAAIMVGAGFSKNANKDFPDWAKLGGLFFEKIHGRKPNKNDGEDRYLNVLKLADEVQAAFGRQTLNQLLRDNIPDKDSEPSPLHSKMLELPWSDVFTTNYDTLLERACDSVSSQRYDIVVNKEDLVHSEKPRIIKLHGSFPSERPFIITEEDYRTYLKVFAPFVNTVQQSLLENTLCLIGFSGDDPNFLQWIGWIRDNLGKANSPKIFLVGIFNLSDAQKKLLEQRNIVIVDLSKCDDVEGDHYKAIDRFFDYLLSRRKDENRLDWPENLNKQIPDENSDRITQLKEIIAEWRQTRLSYPGWVVVPEDRRKDLWEFSRYWINYVTIKDAVPEQMDLQFSFDLNWRLERCLCPIPNNVAELFEATIHKYWPFKETCPERSAICLSDVKHQNLDWEEIRKMWLHLSLSMLRFYREEGKSTKWDAANRKLEELINYLSPTEKAFLYYERVLSALFKLDIPKVKSELSSWPTNLSIPFWEAKRAGLLAELGQTEEAERILERSLQEIRSKLNLRPVTTNYSLVSEEASTMLLFRDVKSSNSFKEGGWEEREETRRELSKRWHSFAQYKCNPWDEIKLFKNRLERPYIERTPVTEERGFDIGRITRTPPMHGSDQEVLTAYAFLRYFEESGFPFKILGSPLAKGSAKGAVQRLFNYSPYWALATLVRVGDEKATDEAFNRQALLKYNTNDIDSLIDEYLGALERAEPDISEGGEVLKFFVITTNNFGVLLAQIVPEILSRLCCKCTKDKKFLLLGFLQKVYGSENKNYYHGISNLLKRLLATYSEPDLYMLIPKLLDIPYPENTNYITEREYINPFGLINIERNSVFSTKKLFLKPDRINALLDLASHENNAKRKWGIFSLVWLYMRRLLTDDQAERLGVILWSKTDDSGFPANTGYYKFAFLDIPHPKDIDPYALIKSHIKNADFPVQNDKKEEGVRTTGGDLLLCQEIIGANQYIEWSKEEIDNLLERLANWWNLDKEYLKKDDTPWISYSISKEFRNRFAGLKDVLVEVVFPHLKGNSISEEQRDTIIKLVRELDEYGLLAAQVKVAGLHILQIEEDALFEEIENALSSNALNEVVDGLRAILLLVKIDSLILSEPTNRVLMLLGQKSRWRHQVGLVSSLNIVWTIAKDHSQHLSGEFESACLHGLGALADETDLDQNIDESEFSKRLEHRRAAANLADQLYRIYQQRESAIPAEVEAWKEICSREEEFAEIKVQWWPGSMFSQ